MGNMPPYMDMHQPRMAGPNIAIPQPSNSTQNAGKEFSLLAQATALSDEKLNPSSSNSEADAASSAPVSASSIVSHAESMLPIGEEIQLLKTVPNREIVINSQSSNKGAAKSSSFEKIMMKLNMQFPKHSK